MNKASIDPKRDAEICDIARIYLGFETLAERGANRLDFREVFVGAVKDALNEAYAAGLAAGRARLGSQ